MYTSIITKTDLETHLYPEVRDEIAREDDNIITAAIATAIAEAKLYLAKYDIAALFGDEQEDEAATHSDNYLKSLVKDLACWHLMKLANINMDYERVRKGYEDGIATLKMIQNGKMDPRWPYADASAFDEEPPGLSVTVHSNPKRTNGY